MGTGLCAIVRNFFSNFGLKMVSCGAFWVVFYVTESNNYKNAKGRKVADVLCSVHGLKCAS